MLNQPAAFGDTKVLNKGVDLAVVPAGGSGDPAVSAAKKLGVMGISTAVLYAPEHRPVDEAALAYYAELTAALLVAPQMEARVRALFPRGVLIGVLPGGDEQAIIEGARALMRAKNNSSTLIDIMK